MLLSRLPIVAEAFGHRHARTSPGRAARVEPLDFGKRLDETVEETDRPGANSLAADARLFALTFAAGFLFVSVLIA
jgi:hypothetical protein